MTKGGKPSKVVCSVAGSFLLAVTSFGCQPSVEPCTPDTCQSMGRELRRGVLIPGRPEPAGLNRYLYLLLLDNVRGNPRVKAAVVAYLNCFERDASDGSEGALLFLPLRHDPGRVDWSNNKLARWILGEEGPTELDMDRTLELAHALLPTEQLQRAHILVVASAVPLSRITSAPADLVVVDLSDVPPSRMGAHFATIQRYVQGQSSNPQPFEEWLKDQAVYLNDGLEYTPLRFWFTPSGEPPEGFCTRG